MSAGTGGQCSNILPCGIADVADDFQGTAIDRDGGVAESFQILRGVVQNQRTTLIQRNGRGYFTDGTVAAQDKIASF